MDTELVKASKESFENNYNVYGLVCCVDQKAYSCGYIEGYKAANDIWAIQIEMLQSKVRELEKEKQPDCPTLNRQK